MTGETCYLDLADYLLLAEAVLGVKASELAYAADLGLAESALVAPAASFEVLDSQSVLSFARDA
ncbi:MAG: hypothetical protein M1565_07850 [Actinobacteria bacterium]|nr:hypothetical protein [Actinomycetota bacterium]